MAVTAIVNDTASGSADTNSGNKVVAAAGTVTTGDLGVVVVVASGQTGTFGCTDNHPDGLGVYTKICDVLSNGSTNQMTVLVRNSLFGSSAIPTITTTGLSTNTGGGFVFAQIRGITVAGAASVRQFGFQNNVAANNTPEVDFPSPVASSSGLFGCHMIDANSSLANPPTGFNAFTSLTWLTPNFTVKGCGLISPSGTAFPWGSGFNATCAAVLLELNNIGPAPAANSIQVINNALFPKPVLRN